MSASPSAARHSASTSARELGQGDAVVEDHRVGARRAARRAAPAGR